MRRSMRTVILFSGILLILLIQASCENRSLGDPESGRRLFSLMHCDACHGEGGKGGQAPALAGITKRYGEFRKKLREPGTALMPRFGPSRLSDQDIADILAYLRGLEK